MTDRIDGTEFTEMYNAASMAKASGFAQVTCDVGVLLKIMAEVVARRMVDRWIPVSETRPSDNHVYLVLYDDDQQDVAWYGEFGGGKWWEWNIDSADGERPFRAEVTHYRELPPGLEGT